MDRRSFLKRTLGIVGGLLGISLFKPKEEKVYKIDLPESVKMREYPKNHPEGTLIFMESIPETKRLFTNYCIYRVDCNGNLQRIKDIPILEKMGNA